MTRRSVFGKIWKHGAEVDYIFPGISKELVTEKIDEMKKNKSRLAAVNLLGRVKLFTIKLNFHSSVIDVLKFNALPASVVNIRFRQVTAPTLQNWNGKMGINVIDSPQLVERVPPPKITLQGKSSMLPRFTHDGARLDGRELRTIFIGTWMNHDRTFPPKVLNELPHARYDKDAVDLVLDIYRRSATSVFKELHAMKRSIRKSMNTLPRI